MSKKILAGLLVAAALVVGFVVLNLDGIVQKVVEKYGSEATQTSVSLGAVKISLQTGEGTLGKLSVGNPDGFSGSKAFSFDSISVKVDPQSLAGAGPIIVKDVVIEKPSVNYEVTAGGENNLGIIQRNASAPASINAAEETAATPPRKVVIEKLTITNGTISITSPMLKEPMTASLPKIEMHNLGRNNNGGLSPAEVAHLLVTTLTGDAAKAATANIVKEVGKLKDAAVEGVGEKAGEAMKAGATGVQEGVGKGVDAMKGLLDN